MRAGVKRARNRAPFALDVYYNKKLLGDGNENEWRFDAGNRFRMDFTIADLNPNIISSYQEWIASGDSAEWSDFRLDAIRRWREAVDAIGPIASNEVISVCCFGESIGRDRMEILRRGLEILAAHYGQKKIL